MNAPNKPITWAAAHLCSLILGLSAAAAEFSTNITLVSNLDPFVGSLRYGDVWGEGNIACVGSWQGSGVAIIDISVPTSPRLLGTYDPPGGEGFRMEDCQIRNRVGFFASDTTNGVHIVSLTNAAAPVLLSKITPAINGHSGVHNLFVDGNYLYEADGLTPTVKVFDVRDPTAPAFVRDIVSTDPSFVHDITVVSNRLYTSGGGGWTDILDVTDIGAREPILLGRVPSGLISHSSWVTADNRIMATCAELDRRDLRLYDVSDPPNPRLLSTITSASLGLDASGPHNPVIVGELLFVSWFQAGLQIFDIRNPSNPVRLGAYDTFPGGMYAPNNYYTPNPICIRGLPCLPGTTFGGNWGVYPFLGFDRVLLSDIERGLIVLDTSAAIPSDLPPFLVVDHATVFEGDSGTTNAVFHLRLSRSSDAIVSVDFATTNGSAEAGGDYDPLSGTLVFTPGQTSQSINIVVNGNMADEIDEYFTIHFANPTNLLLVTQQAVGTIVDNVQPPPGFTSPAFTPTNGYPGRTVTLTGTNLTWTTRVLFNGASAVFSHTSGNNYAGSLTVTIPPDATSGPITIETVHGNVTSANLFTVLIPPTLTIRPLSGTNLVELSWLSTVGFSLQRTDNIGTTNWTGVQVFSPRLTNGVRIVNVSLVPSNRFFRLRNVNP